jgi:hypothetical protein
MTVEHVHVHSGGQAVVGMFGTPGVGDRAKIEVQRKLPMRSARDAVPAAGRPGSRANRQQC